MQRKGYDLAALGEILIDFAPAGQNEQNYPKLSAYPGGAPLNFLATAASYGCSTAFIGRVGADAFGQRLRETVEAYGIDTRALASDPEAFTTLAFVHLDASGDRSFSFARKPGADTRLRLGSVEKEIIQSSRWLHYGSLSMSDEPARTATFEALDYAKASKTLLSFDPNWRPALWDDPEQARARMRDGLAYADLVKMGADELAFIYPDVRHEAERVKHVLDVGVKLLLLTRGADGCTVYSPELLFNQAGLDGLHVKDTTGAGDIFGGAFLAQLIQAGPLEPSLKLAALQVMVRRATIAAGLSTEHHGGLSSITAWEQVLAYEKAHAV